MAFSGTLNGIADLISVSEAIVGILKTPSTIHAPRYWLCEVTLNTFTLVWRHSLVLLLLG